MTCEICQKDKPDVLRRTAPDKQDAHQGKAMCTVCCAQLMHRLWMLESEYLKAHPELAGDAA